LIKSLIHKIKEQKNFQNFTTSTDRWNRKENVKNNKKIKKNKILKQGISKQKIFHICNIVLKELLEISRIRW